MTTKRIHNWVWWLLPLLVARALMPVGFMPQMVHGQLQVVLCQGGVTKVQAVYSPDQASSGIAGDANNDKSSSHWQHDFSCPFGHVAAVPVPHLVASDAVACFSAVFIPSITQPHYEAVGPPRFIATRGPPPLA
jgi:hypothetical protein